MSGPDVIVVGAGPAGSVTARLLALTGTEVLLLDRSEFPRPKACGDCLSAAATGLLRRVGLLDRVMDAGAVPIERWDIFAPDGTVASGRFPDHPALALERRLLDSVLWDAAREAGVRFRVAHVTRLHRDGAGRVHGVVARSGEILSARLVVGADGLRSVVARELGVIRRPPKLRKVSLTAHVDAPAAMRHGEMHVLAGGCIGVAPAGPGRANLTLVVDAAGAEELGRLGPEPLFQSRIQRVAALRDRFGTASLGPLLASGPFDWPTRSPVAHGAALVGDAAGYYDPFTGQGIYQAMAAAEHLAGAVAPALARHRPDRELDRGLRAYAHAKKRLTRPARRVQWVVEAVVSRPAVASAVLGRLAVAPAAMDRLIEVTGDLRPPGSLLSPVVVSSLMFPPDPETA